MSEYQLKYKKDHPRCAGDGCTHKSDCKKYEARQEALDNDIHQGHYIEASHCIANNFSELAFGGEVVVST